jgi:hypothetical protein
MTDVFGVGDEDAVRLEVLEVLDETVPRSEPSAEGVGG